MLSARAGGEHRSAEFGNPRPQIEAPCSAHHSSATRKWDEIGTTESLGVVVRTYEDPLICRRFRE